MKYIEIECNYCEIAYGIEYDQDGATTLSDNDKPVYCPFCGELNEDDDSVRDSEELDDGC